VQLTESHADPPALPPSRLGSGATSIRALRKFRNHDGDKSGSKRSKYVISLVSHLASFPLSLVVQFFTSSPTSYGLPVFAPVLRPSTHRVYDSSMSTGTGGGITGKPSGDALRSVAYQCFSIKHVRVYLDCRKEERGTYASLHADVCSANKNCDWSGARSRRGGVSRPTL
jgi:hypothetical protein